MFIFSAILTVQYVYENVTYKKNVEVTSEHAEIVIRRVNCIY
jgi:hypothetical protein